MNTTKDEVLEIAKSHLKKINLPYREDIPIEAIYNEKERIRTGEFKNVWKVSYEFDLFNDTELNFVVIDDDTSEVLYILTKHGYIENDETFDDDDDNDEDSSDEDMDDW